MSNLDLQTLLAAAYGGRGGSGGGGGTGTSNYNDLSNRPKINGVTLSGDKTPEDLGIPTMTEDEKEKLEKVKETDTELSETSENNVQNKVVTGALKAVQEAVEGISDELDKKVDAETGKGLSTNDYDNTAKGIVDGITAKVDGKVDKVTGKGLSTNDFDNDAKKKLNDLPENADLQDALSAKAAQSEVDVIANAGAKNLLKNGADSVTKTYNGVTATLNSDGSLTINGTATSDFYYYFVKDFVLKAGKYILSNGKAGNSNVMLQMNGEATASVVATDAEVTLETDATVNIFARVRSGGTANNITFYPMLRSASITDDTYVPYGMSNAELTAKKQDAGNYVNNGSGALPGGQTFTGGAAIGYFRSSNVNKGIIISGSAASELSETAPLEYLRFNRVTKKIEHQIYDGTNWQTEATYSADEDTGWQTPDPTNLPNFKYRRKNGHVTVTGYGGVGGVAAKTTKTLFTLPEGFRPSIRVDSAAHLANGSNEPVCQLLVTTDGKVNVWANTEIASNVSVCGSVSFPV